MQDKAYLEELDQIGRRRQLEDDAEYAKEAQRIVMGDNMSNLLSEMGFQTTQAATKRERAEEIAKMSIEDAMALVQANIQDANTRARWEAASSGVQAIAAHAAKDQE